MDWKVSVVGFVVGVLIGLTGMGGGTVMTPLMIFVFHMHPALAVGTDLVYSSLTKMAGAIQHIRQRTVDFRALKFLAIGTVPGALGGSLLVGLLERHLPMQHFNTVVGRALGAVYILVIASMVWRWWAARRGGRRKPEGAVPLPRLGLVALGLVAGFLVGLTSVGSGTLYIAVLALIYPIASARMVGTDIVVGVLVTGVAGLTHMAFGNVDLRMVLSLLVGSIPGILLGSKVTVRLPEPAVRVGLMAMLCWSSWNLLLR
ncbi:MAG: sulfite exporter TauE/SafE family protein [Alicyclobacillaceae bacterium]|nr:sulfite exporter TauE/SafE family protein [Alicyclobacillaceae bacterium]